MGPVSGAGRRECGLLCVSLYRFYRIFAEEIELHQRQRPFLQLLADNHGDDKIIPGAEEREYDSGAMDGAVWMLQEYDHENAFRDAAKEIALAAGLGFNSIRFFVPFDQ